MTTGAENSPHNLITQQDEIINLIDQIDKQQADLEAFQQQAKDKLEQLKQEVYFHIAKTLMRCDKNNAHKVASQIYWYGIDHSGIAGSVKAMFKKLFGYGFIPEAISIGIPCKECGQDITVVSIASYNNPPLECPQCMANQNQRYQREYEKEQEQKQIRIQQLRSMPYSEYLQTPEWGMTRKAALKRAKYRCQLCNAEGILHVHHRSYEHLGSELASDLIVLCSDCHAKFHDKGVVR